MIKKPKIAERKLVTNYKEIHPALDFLEQGAIVSIGTKWQYELDDKSIDFDINPICICSDGDNFYYSKQDLAERKFFYQGSLDVPLERWDIDDALNFCKCKKSQTFQEVYDLIYSQVDYYIDFHNEKVGHLISTFILFTYFYPIFENVPILQLWGEFQTGKTKICNIIEALAFNPINSSNISSSTVFRKVQSSRSVVILDESEDLTVSERGKDIVNMLLAGTGKSGKAYRQEKGINDNFQTSEFTVFSPKVIANISGIANTALQSRIIKVVTLGSTNKVKINRDIDLSLPKWQLIRNQIYRLVLCKYKTVMLKKKTMEKNGHYGRTYQIWRGLLTIASVIDENLFNILQEIVLDNKTYMEMEAETETNKTKLLIIEMIKLRSEYPEQEWFTPSYLYDKFKSPVNLTSSRDLGLSLGKLDMISRTLKREDHNGNEREGRFYNINTLQLRKLANNYNLKRFYEEMIRD